MKKLIITLILLCLTVSISVEAKKTTWANEGGLQQKGLYLGPTLGYYAYTFSLGGLGIGASGEYILTDVVGIGAIGVGGDIAYTSFSDDYYWGKYKYTDIGITAYASYHFLPGKKFDPFGRVGFGYSILSSSYESNYGYTHYYDDSHGSGIDLIYQVGFRYFFSPAFSIRVVAGFPYLIGAGVDFKL